MRSPGGQYGGLMATQSIYETSSVANCAIGTRLPMGDRTFFYGHAVATVAAGLLAAPDASNAGPVLLADGSLVAMTAAQAQLSPIAITAALTVGQKFIALTHASALDNITKDELQNGYVVLTDSAGVDVIHKIKRNNAWSASVADYVEIELWDEIQAAMADATTGVILTCSQYRNLRPATQGTDESPIGVPLVSVAAGYYGWFQTWGPAGVVTVTDTAIGGQDVEFQSTGQVALRDTDGVEARIGYGMADVTAAGDMGLVMLQIAP